MNLFKGRLNRRSFIIGWIVTVVLIFLLLQLLASATSTLPKDFYFLGHQTNKLYIMLGISLYIIWHLILVSLSIRRLHDFNRSGWWAVLFLFPPLEVFTQSLLPLFLSINPGNKTINNYGDPPSPAVDLRGILGIN